MGTTKWVVFSSFLWHLLVPLLLFNSPSITCKLGNHGVWIRSPTFLQVDKETLLQHYLKKLKYSTVYSTSRPTSWSQHLMNFLDPCILYSPVNSSYMVGCQCVPQCWSVASECILWGYIDLKTQGILPLVAILTSCPQNTELSFPQLVWPPYDKNHL